MRETCDKLHANGIGVADEHNRDGLRRPLFRQGRRERRRDQDIDLQGDKLDREGIEFFRVLAWIAVLEHNVLAVDVAELGKSLAKRAAERRFFFGIGGMPEDTNDRYSVCCSYRKGTYNC
jgi:hypothetical protein